ncbi:MAG: DUF2927 domain-containing protein [Bacteroidota bacterium]
MNNRYYLLLCLSIFIFLSSCTKDEEIIEPQGADSELTDFELETIDYFKEVALGFENGGVPEITRRWNAPMKIFIDGNPSEKNMAKVIEAMTIINSLQTLDDFYVELVEEENLSNCYLFFGSALEFEMMFSGVTVGSNYGNFYVWWQSNNINRARIFVDTDRANEEQQESLILEEITQALGLGKDSPKYTNSIFYETPTNGGFATEYSEIDKELIRLLYHPAMSVGLNAAQVDRVLRNILEND